MSETYKPTEHDGLKQDGTPDKRVGTGEFAQGKVDPHEAGKQGGATTGTGSAGYSETSNGGSAKGQFAHGKVDPVEAGKKGGATSGTGSAGYSETSNGGSAKGQFAHGKVDPVEAGKKGGQISS
ncbi:hypothetical protein E2P81_ATG10836 [Venturia nashicola]|uniref:Uncharacterized protein n=1 Tax=Venturia nashicola TaxID=86259 RepID=A0A4Z1P213_9PEZI|nr:hypothetical protein E6O75_ATG10509 [Venturia nashicola]TLD27548.1 hypothetical protein E2P81_ATG10836 [Venturia nashicola]